MVKGLKVVVVVKGLKVVVVVKGLKVVVVVIGGTGGTIFELDLQQGKSTI